MAVSERAVFLDKDGTLIDNVPYNIDPARVRLSAGAGQATRALHDAGYRLFVISNQGGVGLGLFPASALADVEEEVRAQLAAAGVPLQAMYACPHHPRASDPEYAVHCDCRKPAAGMILRAAAEHHIALAESWMVGDILDDVEAGARAGCGTILIDNGGETEWRRSRWRTPDFIVRDLPEATRCILAEGGSGD
jgi:histidinol-phosphate phosphatase family protein